MAKGQGEGQGPEESGSLAKTGGNPLALGALVGVLALLLIAFANWWHVKKVDRTRPGQVATATRAPSPAAKRPDPNRVYTIQTADAPTRGPVGAPVTIAEFSDFQ